NADQGFAATNHSGTQINLWGQVPGLNWDVRSQNAANIYGSYYPTPQPTYIQMPYQAPSTGLENAVTHQQLTAIAGHLTQCIDQTRHMTVAEVRESLKQLSEKIRQPDVNRLGSRPLLAISQGEGNADQGFAATNHSGTQINLWGQVPGLNWDVRSQNAANIYGSYYPTPQPTYIQMPYQAPSTGLENAVTHQQLTAIAGHLTQRWMTLFYSDTTLCPVLGCCIKAPGSCVYRSRTIPALARFISS
ncbi:hypothetical protein X801_03387, partial [Opisthorchis viverrini]